MSISAPGSRGYGDWQRVDNWDSDPILQEFINPTVGGITSGVLDVSRFAYLGGSVQVTGGTCLMQVNWYADQALTEQIGSRRWTLGAPPGSPCSMRVPNLGPFCTVGFFLIGGAPLADVLLIATNRYNPLEFIPQFPLLVSQQNVTIAAAGSLTVTMGDYYAGPVQWWVANPTGSVAMLRFNFIDVDGTNKTIYQAQIPVTADTNGTAIVPPGIWSAVLINNSGAAANFFLTVRHSVTGAV